MTTPTLTRTLFERLGWTTEFLTEFNDPTHPDLLDLDVMIEKLRVIHDTKTKIVVMPDFDTDGVTSGVIAYAGLSQLGFDVEIYVPDYRHGHDITPEAVAQLMVEHPDVRVVITTDAGTNSHEGIAFAHSCGLRVLVTDHHQQLPADEPLKAELIINPCRLDETYPHPGICGAFVIFQILNAYARAHAPKQLTYMNRLALFAGLGTVSDVMPLYYENRNLVRRSLSLARLAYDPKDYQRSALYETVVHELARNLITPVYAHAFFGFGQLLEIMTERDIIRDAFLREDLYAFYIAPAVNSARRILSDGGNAFRIFTAETTAARADAVNAVLDDNEKRKELSAQYLAELQDSDQPFAPYVWISEAPGGMLGLLASHLSRDLDAPVVVLRRSNNQHRKPRYSGSARAPMDVDIVAGFDQLDGLRAVGHAQACGVAADTKADLAVMADILCALDTRRDRTVDKTEPFPGLILGDTAVADAQAPTHDELLELIESVTAIGPFGHGFPQPVHRVVLDPAFTLVTELGRATYDEDGNELIPAGRHTKLTSLSSGLQLLWWNSATEREQLPTTLSDLVDPDQDIDAAPLEFLVTLSTNTFMGRTKPQAIVQARLA